MAKMSVDYHPHLIESLKNPREAVEYLKAALEENDLPEVFLIALRNVAEARGIRNISEETKLNFRCPGFEAFCGIEGFIKASLKKWWR
jgi:DNA-binding phage protein